MGRAELSSNTQMPARTEFRPTDDPQSFEIVSEGETIGHLISHDGNIRAIFDTPDSTATFTVTTLGDIVARGSKVLLEIRLRYMIEHPEDPANDSF
jgi:hypothetical protein